MGWMIEEVPGDEIITVFQIGDQQFLIRKVSTEAGLELPRSPS